MFCALFFCKVNIYIARMYNITITSILHHVTIRPKSRPQYAQCYIFKNIMIQK